MSEKYKVDSVDYAVMFAGAGMGMTSILLWRIVLQDAGPIAILSDVLAFSPWEIAFAFVMLQMFLLGYSLFAFILLAEGIWGKTGLMRHSFHEAGQMLTRLSSQTSTMNRGGKSVSK